MTEPKPDSVPWMLPGLFDPLGADFDPAAYMLVEVHPVRHGEGSLVRCDPAADDIAQWSVYLQQVPDGDGIAPHDCVADLSNQCAALALAAALASQYGYETGEGSPIEAMQIASGAPRYVIEPQHDLLRLVVRNEAGADETEFAPCDEAEAETFAVFYYEPGGERGDAMGLEDFPTRAAAVAFINGHRSGKPIR